jgi:hypothetical protein
MPIAARLKACPGTIILGNLHYWQSALLTGKLHYWQSAPLANSTTADYSTVRLAV